MVQLEGLGREFFFLDRLATLRRHIVTFDFLAGGSVCAKDTLDFSAGSSSCEHIVLGKSWRARVSLTCGEDAGFLLLLRLYRGIVVQAVCGTNGI